MNKVIVTGYGFVAHELIKNTEYNWVIIEKDRNKICDSGHKVYYIDLYDIDALEEIIRIERPECIIHTAADKYIDRCEENILSSIDDNIIATRNLVKLKEKYDYHLVYLSTDKAVEPISIYGTEKMLGERLVLQCGGTIVRSVNIKGSTGSILPLWSSLIREGKPIHVRGKDTYRWMINPEECCKVLIKAMNYKGVTIVPKNIEHINIYELAKTLTDNIILEKGVNSFEKTDEKVCWDNENTLIL